jgi:hypothetical protein
MQLGIIFLFFGLVFSSLNNDSKELSILGSGVGFGCFNMGDVMFKGGQ